MRERIYLGRLEELIKNYQFDLPLSLYLRQEFNKRRNMGSRDRKRTREDIFSFYRIGKIFPEMTTSERIALGTFICGTSRNPETDFILTSYSPFLPENMTISLDEKLEKVKEYFPDFELEEIFPFSKHLSPQIDKHLFIRSFLQQPKLWIRVRSAFRDKVINELKERNFSFDVHAGNPCALSLLNSTPVHELTSYDKGYFEIQDLNSQNCIADLKIEDNEIWWDACAGAGGKSLALLDMHPNLNITASDIRESSLQNLKSRMSKASLNLESIIQIDLSADGSVPINHFDGILADVPCSGSGTWARTPEMISSFSEKNLSEKYIPLQRKIVKNLTNALKPEKYLIYITCSAFKSENEENIRHFEENLGLKCHSSSYFEGSGLAADTMYRAILSKNN